MTDVKNMAELVARPLTPDDAVAVYELTKAAELHDTGSSMIELEDVHSDWSRPSYELDRQSIGYLEDGSLVAYGEVHRNRREAYVHPDHRGRGIGETMYAWSIEKARELGYDRVGQTVPVSNESAIALFTRHGCALLYTSWILELPEGAAIAHADLPTGHRLRDFVEDRDAVETFTMFEEAFNEWPNRPPATLEDWRAMVLGRAGFEPWQLFTVVEEIDGVETILGACKVSVYEDDGWIDQVAVRRSARGRGLGRALLVEAFERARAHGATRSRLNTDSRTGALGLYLHVGMEVCETYEHYSVDIA